MSGQGFRWQRTAHDVSLADLLEAGVLTDALVLAPPDGLEAPLSVRPLAADLEDDWAPPIRQALGGASGARVGVAADDPALAAGVAAELAVRLGGGGERVVLVDGSVEEPSLSKAHPDDGDEGLVDIVAFGVSPVRGVRRTLAAGVSLVTAGSYPLSSTEVFEAEGFSRFLTTVSRGAAVVLVLPRRHLRPAAAELTAVVAVARSGEELRSLAGDAQGRPVIGILAAPTEALVAVADGASTGLWEGEGRSQEAREVERAAAAHLSGVPSEEAPEPESRAVAYAPSDGAAEREPEVLAPAPSDGAAEPEARAVAPGAEEPAPTPEEPRARETRPVVTAARRLEPRPRRWRSRPAAAVVVIAAAAVAAWLGLRALRGGPAGPARDAGRPTPADVSARPGREPGSDLGREGEPREVDEPAGAAVDRAGRQAGESPAAVSAPGAASGEARPGQGPADRTAPGEHPGGPIAGPGGPYVLFVSSHRIASEASTAVEALTGLDVSVRVVPTEVGNTGLWYRVAVSGGYPTIAAARSALAQVHLLGYEGAWIERSEESR